MNRRLFRSNVHNSPPRHGSISMYKYFGQLNVWYILTMKGLLHSSMISFSLRMCCCCFTSLISFFLSFLRAKGVFVGPAVTSSTLPKPPTPRVATQTSSSSLTVWAEKSEEEGTSCSLSISLSSVLCSSCSSSQGRESETGTVWSSPSCCFHSCQVTPPCFPSLSSSLFQLVSN